MLIQPSYGHITAIVARPIAFQKPSDNDVGHSGPRFSGLALNRTSGPAIRNNKKPTLITAVTFCRLAAHRVPSTLTTVQISTSTMLTPHCVQCDSGTAEAK